MSILDVFALLGGVGLFLYGMMEMSSGLKNAAGDNLRIILEKANGKNTSWTRWKNMYITNIQCDSWQ